MMVGKSVGAYYAAWATYARNYQVFDIDATKLTHVFYAFFNLQSDGKVVSGDTYADFEKRFPTDSWGDQGKNLYGNLKQLFELKKAHRHLKVSLSVGGWTWSSQFSTVAARPETRRTFVESCVQHVANLGFDGVCVDWEYPVVPGLEGNKSSPQDAVNFLTLLRELRSALDRYGASIGEKLPQSRFLVSACLGATRNRLEVLDLAALAEVVDELHLMSYDFNGSWSPMASHHANLLGGGINADAAVDLILSRGVPPQKLILGVPMYGRAFCNTGGLGQPFVGVGDVNQEKGSWEGGVWDYKALPLEGAKEFLDTQCVAGYSYDPIRKQLISYDTPESLTTKIDYVKRRGLGGVFFWELSGDKCPKKLPDRSLLATAYASLGGREGGVDDSPNHLNYPQSVYDNIRQGNCNGTRFVPPVGQSYPPQPPPFPGSTGLPNAYYPPVPEVVLGPHGPINSPSPCPPLPPRTGVSTSSNGSYPDARCVGNGAYPAFVQVPLPPLAPNSRPRRIIVAAEVLFDNNGGHTVRSLPIMESDGA